MGANEQCAGIEKCIVLMSKWCQLIILIARLMELREEGKGKQTIHLRKTLLHRPIHLCGLVQSRWVAIR